VCPWCQAVLQPAGAPRPLAAATAPLHTTGAAVAAVAVLGPTRALGAVAH
jgi:hypothetical protein